MTTNDVELSNLLVIIDNYINLRLAHYTSLPLQIAMQSQLADIESRWVAIRFRLRRATPQEQQQYETLLTEIEKEFQQFLDANFQLYFKGVGSQTSVDAPIDYGQFEQTGAGSTYP